MNKKQMYFPALEMSMNFNIRKVGGKRSGER